MNLPSSSLKFLEVLNLAGKLELGIRANPCVALGHSPA